MKRAQTQMFYTSVYERNAVRLSTEAHLPSTVYVRQCASVPLKSYTEITLISWARCRANNKTKKSQIIIIYLTHLINLLFVAVFIH